MKNLRCYYSASVKEFLKQSENEIVGIIHSNDISAKTPLQQSTTWKTEVEILKRQLSSIEEGHIVFEYVIPRMGKRIDAVVLYKNIVFLLEFKCGDFEYKASTYDQVYDYALDLKSFQKESFDKLLVPMMISTRAKPTANTITEKNNILTPLRCNSNNIFENIKNVSKIYTLPNFDYIAWVNSEYFPTPTIVEAAQALYRGHNVHDITRSDAGAENLTVTTSEINKIIEYSKANNCKSICFVTGVPGAGKTLVGLNLAIERSNSAQNEHAVFLSGNFPLVNVLQEALARDKVAQEKTFGNSFSKADELRKTASFIQIIHKYRDSFVGNDNVPPERIVIFDEAQRAWNHSKIEQFMISKKGVSEFPYSEPEFLISTMDRHDGYAVIVCLIGGGQEINTGEAGLPEWFESLHRSFPHWNVYITRQLNDVEYRRNYRWSDMVGNLNIIERSELHLSTSVRSFRASDLSSFIKALLDNDVANAKKLFNQIHSKYPIYITRNFNTAKQWVKNQALGTTRYGILASSGALRLKPEGIFVKNDISVANWFLNGKNDVRSSYALEDVATEFDVQGLELDYTIVAWDADFRFANGEWSYHNFVGNKWINVNSEEKKLYLKNAYRVLLTRARQGFIIFIPEGSNDDITRSRDLYNSTCEYLKSLGIIEL